MTSTYTFQRACQRRISISSFFAQSSRRCCDLRHFEYSSLFILRWRTSCKNRSKGFGSIENQLRRRPKYVIWSKRRSWELWSSETAMLQRSENEALFIARGPTVVVDEKKRRLLLSLSSLNYEYKHRLTQKMPHAGTGAWFSSLSEFTTWKQCSSSAVLCCYGIRESNLATVWQFSKAIISSWLWQICFDI